MGNGSRKNSVCGRTCLVLFSTSGLVGAIECAVLRESDQTKFQFELVRKKGVSPWPLEFLGTQEWCTRVRRKGLHDFDIPGAGERGVNGRVWGGDSAEVLG